MLQKLHTKVKNTCHSKCNNSIILHDNVHPYVAYTVQDQLNAVQWEVLKHPAYSPDLHYVIVISLDC
jgi:hypothetical protein